MRYISEEQVANATIHGDAAVRPGSRIRQLFNAEAMTRGQRPCCPAPEVVLFLQHYLLYFQTASIKVQNVASS
jgi:hypothetical protein